MKANQKKEENGQFVLFGLEKNKKSFVEAKAEAKAEQEADASIFTDADDEKDLKEAEAEKLEKFSLPKSNQSERYVKKYTECSQEVCRILRRAVGYYWGRPSFAVLFADNGTAEEDMYGYVMERLVRKHVFRHGPMSEVLLFRFVWQQFITRALYNKRHFADVIFEDDTYRQKCIHFAELGNSYGDTEEAVEESDALSSIGKLSAKPIIEGRFAVSRFNRNVSVRSVVELVYNGYSLTDIVKSYQGKKKYPAIKKAVEYLFDVGTKNLKRQMTYR